MNEFNTTNDQQPSGVEPSRPPEGESQASSLGVTALELLKIVIIAALIILPIRLFVIQPFYVKGQSMEPNFHDDEYLIIDKLTPRFQKYHRGEVVVIRFPRLNAPYLIKRVIALPGERIVISEGKLRIFNDDYPQGMALNEDEYTPRPTPNQYIDQILSADEYYILGDNRPNSIGSQSFGPIRVEQIVGRVVFRGLPLNKIKVFTPPTYAPTKP